MRERERERERDFVLNKWLHRTWYNNVKKLFSKTFYHDYIKIALQPEPHYRLLGSTRICRHDGHDELRRIHLSMHFTWNPWPHCGITLISSPFINSVKHIAHSPNFPSPVYLTLGTDERILSSFGPPFGGDCAVELLAAVFPPPWW